MKGQPWRDGDDGFDYQQAAREVQLPMTHYYAAIKDLSLGHRFDVKHFMQESRPQPQDLHDDYTLLARRHGHARDYDHIDMLTAPACVTDHFPALLNWLKKQQANGRHQA